MDTLNRQFGLVIAYLLPGFVALIGFAPIVPMVARWLAVDQTASVGAPVYALLAAAAAGMVVSCFRWLLVDRVLALTGVPRPAFNSRALEQHPDAFHYLVEVHYRYYQFYSNALVSLVWAYSVNRWLRTSSRLRLGTDLGVFLLCAVLFAGSRDALAKYRARSAQLVGQVPVRDLDGDTMTNGIDHIEEKENTSERLPAAPKPAAKPKAPAKAKTPASASKSVKR